MLRLLVALVLVSACARPRASIGGTPAPRGRSEVTAHSVKADVVLRGYASNPTSADNTYNDRLWEVRGVRLTFEDESDVIRLRVGVLADARCEGDGMRGDDVRFEDCVLLRSGLDRVDR